MCRDLAYQIVKDGEGATKVFRVQVIGAASEADADRVGRAIVDSPLVKTAVHGGDPNWGRITTAAGYSGARIIPEKMTLYIGAKDARSAFSAGRSNPGKSQSFRGVAQKTHGLEGSCFTLTCKSWPLKSSGWGAICQGNISGSMRITRRDVPQSRGRTAKDAKDAKMNEDRPNAVGPTPNDDRIESTPP